MDGEQLKLETPDIMNIHRNNTRGNIWRKSSGETLCKTFSVVLPLDLLTLGISKVNSQ